MVSPEVLSVHLDSPASFWGRLCFVGSGGLTGCLTLGILRSAALNPIPMLHFLNLINGALLDAKSSQLKKT